MLLGSGEISILSTSESKTHTPREVSSWFDECSRIGMYDSSRTAITRETERFVIDPRLLGTNLSVWVL